jgi:hypothetical protein
LTLQGHPAARTTEALLQDVLVVLQAIASRTPYPTPAGNIVTTTVQSGTWGMQRVGPLTTGHLMDMDQYCAINQLALTTRNRIVVT